MKKLILISIALIIFFACEKPKQPYAKVIEKEVIDKHEGTESDTKYEYNWLQGKWSLIPKVRTAHYLIFSDRTHQEADIDTYMFTKIGDKRQVTITEYR